MSIYCFSIFLLLKEKNLPLKGFQYFTETNLRPQNYNTIEVFCIYNLNWKQPAQVSLLPTGYGRFTQIIPQHVTAEPDQVLTQTAQTEYNKYVQCISNFYVLKKLLECSQKPKALETFHWIVTRLLAIKEVNPGQDWGGRGRECALCLCLACVVTYT